MRKRYPTDLTDEQWALIEPLLPPVNTGGRPENTRDGWSWTRSGEKLLPVVRARLRCRRA